MAGKTDVRAINKGKEDEFITMAAHRTNGNQSDIKDIEGLKDLIRQIISEEKDK